MLILFLLLLLFFHLFFFSSLSIACETAYEAKLLANPGKLLLAKNSKVCYCFYPNSLTILPKLSNAMKKSTRLNYFR